MMWESLDTIGTAGSEEGIIQRDEEYRNACRITLERCSDRWAITCGVYGAMVHTVYCGENREAVYDAMKRDLQAFIDKVTTSEEEYAFYQEFVTKY